MWQVLALVAVIALSVTAGVNSAYGMKMGASGSSGDEKDKIVLSEKENTNEEKVFENKKTSGGFKFANETKAKEKFTDIAIVFKNGGTEGKKVNLNKEQLEQIVRLIKQLRVQFLRKEQAYKAPKDIDDKALISYVKSHPNLTSLDLGGCYEVTNAVLKVIGENCKWLTSVNVSGCYLVKDEGLKAIGENCKQLTSLDVSGCHLLTDAVLKVIGENCKWLTSLDVIGCYLLTDAGIKVIGENCKRLTSLDVSGCRQVTDAVLKVIGENCKRLMRLKLRGCYLVTDAMLKVIKENCKRLTLTTGPIDSSAIRERCHQLQKISCRKTRLFIWDESE
jgi:hypothetical protein